MSTLSRWLATFTLACIAALWAFTAHAGDFKRITIDGSFEDWAGVPPAVIDEEDAVGMFDFKEIYIANDEEFLYVRVTLHQPFDYAGAHHHILIDADADISTGSIRLGVGSELMFEDGAGYQQKNGGFNEGEATEENWAVAPSGVITQYEARISRAVLDAEGLPVFNSPTIGLGFESQNLSWATTDNAPDGTEVTYDFAPTPPKASGSTTLLSLDGTSWQFNDAGTDLGTDWLLPEYDDTQAGWQSGSGLFGFGVTAGTYPSPVQSTFASGSSTYYLRAPFMWENDSSGIALAVEAYLSDGAVIYLNGAEVRRVRMPDGPIAFNTPATGGPSTPGQAENWTLPPSALVVGNNLLEVELHQAAGTPNELAFGLELVATDSLPPSIEDASQPADREVAEGESTTFSVGSVLGTVPLIYQWFKDGAPIEGATNATLEIPVVLVSDAGQYHVEITNTTGMKATSRTAILTTTATPVTFTNAGEPADRAVAEGQSTTFTVEVAGSPEIVYQWFKDGAAIEGATNIDYTIANVALTDAGQYWVTASNRLGAAESRKAQLAVTQDSVGPSIETVAGSGAKVVVVFSEPLDEASANTAGNYTLSGGAMVQSAALDTTDARTVTLTTSPLTFGTVYTLNVNGVKDRFNNAAVAQSPFRATILIDGDFSDWAGMTPLASETQDLDGQEFKEIYVANDENYLYIRYSFWTEVGEMGEGAYFHIFADTDNDLATGMPQASIGSELMIENSNGYQQKNGSFNEGGIAGLDFLIAPPASSTEFECRISRTATFESDGEPVFAGDTIALALQLISTGWSLIDTAPLGFGIVYTFQEFTPLNPAPLRVRMTGNMLEISWTGPGVLESRDQVNTGNWAPVPNAASPYHVSPTGTQRYYRLRL